MGMQLFPKSIEQTLVWGILLQFSILVTFGTTSNRDILLGFLLVYMVFACRNLGWLRNHATFMLLCLQYPLINILLVSLANVEGEIKPHDAAGFEMWFTSIACIVVSTFFFTTGRNSLNFVTYFIPVGVALAFTVAAFQYFGSGQCRVALFNANVFAAPLFATAFAVIHLIYFSEQQKSGDTLSYFLIFTSLVLSSVFAGARSIYLASVVVIFFLALVLLIQNRWKPAVKLVSTLIVALIASIIIESYTGCNFFLRIGNVLGFLQNSSTAVYSDGLTGIQDVGTGESSMNFRLEMWQRTFSLLEGNYASGLGAHYEAKVSPGKHPHVHNMYLSWLIWGGFISLISGLVFLVAPIIALKAGHMPFHKICLLIALPMIWMVSLLFDSFLFWKHHYLFFILISTLFYSLHSTHNTDR
jgi:hypothetical protein